MTNLENLPNSELLKVWDISHEVGNESLVELREACSAEYLSRYEDLRVGIVAALKAKSLSLIEHTSKVVIFGLMLDKFPSKIRLILTKHVSKSSIAVRITSNISDIYGKPIHFTAESVDAAVDIVKYFMEHYGKVYAPLVDLEYEDVYKS